MVGNEKSLGVRTTTTDDTRNVQTICHYNGCFVAIPPYLVDLPTKDDHSWFFEGTPRPIVPIDETIGSGSEGRGCGLLPCFSGLPATVCKMASA